MKIYLKNNNFQVAGYFCQVSVYSSLFACIFESIFNFLNFFLIKKVYIFESIFLERIYIRVYLERIYIRAYLFERIQIRVYLHIYSSLFFKNAYIFEFIFNFFQFFLLKSIYIRVYFFRTHIYSSLFFQSAYIFEPISSSAYRFESIF